MLFYQLALLSKAEIHLDLPSLSYIFFFDQNKHDINKKNSGELLHLRCCTSKYFKKIFIILITVIEYSSTPVCLYSYIARYIPPIIKILCDIICEKGFHPKRQLGLTKQCFMLNVVNLTSCMPK